MIIEKAIAVLSKREVLSVPGRHAHIAQKIGDIAINVGAWFNPTCYQIQCEHLRDRSGISRESQEGIVNGIGQIIISSVQGDLKVDLRNVHKIIDDVRPALDNVEYHDVFDGPVAEVLHKFAPLHTENE